MPVRTEQQKMVTENIAVILAPDPRRRPGSHSGVVHGVGFEPTRPFE